MTLIADNDSRIQKKNPARLRLDLYFDIMDVIKTMDFIILNGNEFEIFNVKNILYKNGITTNLSSEETHELIEQTISFGKKFGYFKQPTKEQWVELTEKGLKARSLGGHQKFINSINDVSNNITHNYHNVTQVNQSSEKIDLKSPIKQKIVHKTDKAPSKKSWVEILAWIIGIIAGLVAIYEFVIK